MANGTAEDRRAGGLGIGPRRRGGQRAGECRAGASRAEGKRERRAGGGRAVTIAIAAPAAHGARCRWRSPRRRRGAKDPALNQISRLKPDEHGY